MTHLVLLLTFLTCIGITAAWIAENPGHVTMVWFDYRIDTSFAFVLFLTLLSAILITTLLLLVRRLWHTPHLFSRQRSANQQQKGLTELTHSIVALAASDTKAAEAHTRKAEKLLGRTPLTLLLSAQVARTQGDDTRTQSLLEQMLDHKETEYLAARYLSESASKKHQLSKAREMAQRAHTLNPKGIDALLSLNIRLGEWQQAIIAINKALRKGQITRAQLHRYKGIVFAQHAIALMERGQDEAALAVALQAGKQLPTSLPVIQILVRCYIANKQFPKAVNALMAAWKKAPDILLADAFRQATALLPKEKRIKLARKMAAAHPGIYASHMLLAHTHLNAGNWPEARNEVKKAITLTETVTACKLLAEIEISEYSDYDAHGRWLGRSANAQGDATWICSSCGTPAKIWDSHCPHCHSFDTLEWKQRNLTFVS